MNRILLALLLTGLSGQVFAQSPARPSPFQRTGGGAAAPVAAAGPQEFELNGVTTIGASTLVCISNVATKRSHWIPVGESAAGIQVVSRDAASGQVTIRQAGREFTLALRKPTYDPSSLAIYAPTPATLEAPSPVAVAAPVAVTDAEKEAEARFLVSDLLEIGMIQRKAYEEAQAKTLAEKRAAAEADQARPKPAP